MTDVVHLSAAGIDLSSRVRRSVVVVASPAAAAETIIASVAIPDDLAVATGLLLDGWAALTVGTDGTSARLRLRATNVSGTVLGDTGALTGGVAAAGLIAPSVRGVMAAPALPGQVVVLTLAVGAASAVSTVSAVSLTALVV